MICPYCNSRSVDGSWFCGGCFRTLPETRPRRRRLRRRAVAAITLALTLVLGGWSYRDAHEAAAVQEAGARRPAAVVRPAESPRPAPRDAAEREPQVAVGTGDA